MMEALRDMTSISQPFGTPEMRKKTRVFPRAGGIHPWGSAQEAEYMAWVPLFGLESWILCRVSGWKRLKEVKSSGSSYQSG